MLSTIQTAQPAFERVYRGQFDFVLRTLRALGVPESGLDDAVQDVFIVVHRRLPEFEGRSSIKTWAYEIARRVALRYRTRAARDAARNVELPAALPARDDLERAVDHARASEVLQCFLAELDEDRRRAFVLAELWEMSGREIAESLGLNMNTVYSRIRSARAELDRVAHRMQVRNAGALTRALRDRRAPVAIRERTRLGVLMAVGGGAGVGTVGVATLAWAGLTAVACGLAVVLATTVGAPEVSVSAPRTSPVIPDVRATALPVPAPPVVPPSTSVAVARAIPSTPSPSVAAAPRPKARTRTESRAPSLADQLAIVQELRAAVRAQDTAAAQAAIRRYRENAPAGALKAEVDALEIELSCRTAAPKAAAQLTAFAQTHRGSALVDRLTVLCSTNRGD